MDFFKTLQQRKNCISDALPVCRHICPIGLDIDDFIRKLRSGLVPAAYRVFSLHAIMPGVVCHLCPAPCETVCVRGKVDEAISLKALEMFCWQECHRETRKSYYKKAKAKKILVCGGNPLGLAVSARLSRRGYQVDLIEKESKLGGSLRNMDERLLPKEILAEDISLITEEKYLTIWLNESAKQSDLMQYQAVLVADPACVEGSFLHSEHVFTIDPTADYVESPLKALHRGSIFSYQIEEYLKIGELRATIEKKMPAPYMLDPQRVDVRHKALSPDSDKWTTEEIQQEAGRCELCRCNECMEVCPMMQHFGINYRTLAIKLLDTTEAQQIETKRGLYPLMSCMQCGACIEACPVKIDAKTLCLSSRRLLHQKQTLPESHYHFWLNDMEHANHKAEIMIKAEGENRYVYFPGCQMGASNPEYVNKSYEWIRHCFKGQVSLWSRCCGAPALWSGNTELFDLEIESVKSWYEERNKPVFILACPTCIEIFRDYYPFVNVITIWEVMAQSLEQKPKTYKKLAVFDPCAAKYDKKIKDNIRSIVELAGYEPEELTNDGKSSMCCGYGGLVYSTTPLLVDKVVAHNIHLNDQKYITYCTNCMDSFKNSRKDACHIFDIIFSMQSQDSVPTLSERRVNRMQLKHALIENYMGVDKEMPVATYQRLKLEIPADVKEKMDRQLVLDEDIKQVIEAAEQDGKYLYHAEDNEYTAHKQLGAITVWVRYKKMEDTYIIKGVYYHYLKINEVAHKNRV